MKNSFRKISLTVVLICCMLLAGCSSNNSSNKPYFNAKNPVSVILWHSYDGNHKKAFDELVSQFNETVGADKGIIVTATSKKNMNALNADIIDSATEKVGSSQLPDIFTTYADTAYELYQMDKLADLRKYMSQEEMESYVPYFLREGQLSDERLFILPVAKSTELLYVNQTAWKVFAEDTGADPAELATWEGLARIAEKYYIWSGGKAFFGRDAFPNYLILGSRQLGKDIFLVKDGEMTLQLDEKVMKCLWDCYAVPYLKGYYNAHGLFRSEDVKTGEIIACISSTSGTSYFPASVTYNDGTTYPIEGAVYPLPKFQDTNDYAIQQGAGMSVIKSDEQHQRAAVEFLKWFTETEQNTAFAVDTGYVPVKRKANTKENMETALKAAGKDSSSLTYQSALMAVDIFNNTRLCVFRPFEGSLTARTILANFMTEKLEEYKRELAEQSRTNLDRILDNYFKQWLSELEQSLEQK